MRSPLRPLFLLFALLSVLAIIYLANWTPSLRANPLASLNSAPPPSSPSLTGVSVDLATPSKRYAMYSYEDATFLTFPSDQSKDPIDLTTVFPTFMGNVADFIASDSGKAIPYLMVFTKEGMMYSSYPNTPYSQTIWESFIYLPPDGLVGVDARKVISGGKPVTNFGLPSSNLLFTFYIGARRDLTNTDRNNRPLLLSGEIVNELGCTQSVAWTDPQTKQSQMSGSCPLNTTPWNSLAYTGRIVGVSSGVVYTSEGGMWSLMNPSQKIGDWKTILRYDDTTKKIPQLYESSRLSPPDMATFRLMGCDNEETAPFFATNEGGYSYIVSPQAKKIPMSRIIGSQGEKMLIHDLTKLSLVENDFLIAGVDGYLYNPYFSRIRLSDLENTFMGRTNQDRLNSSLSGLTHVASYTLGHKVCFFYSNGDWFFIDYDPKERKMLGLNSEFHYRKGASDNPSGQMSWLDWPHIKDVVSKNLSRMIGISSNDWAVYMSGDTPVNGKIYSFSKPNPGDCTDDNPSCWRFQIAQQTGLGDWKEIDIDKEYTVDKNGNRVNTGKGITHRSVPNFRTLAGKGLQGGQIIGVRYWVSLDSAISTLLYYPTANGFVFDRVLNKVTYYSNPKSTDTNVDLDKNLYIRESYYTTYKNMFTLKHKPTGKYLFYDVLGDQKLDVADGKNWFRGDIQGSATEMSTSMKQSLGGMWGMGSDNSVNNCLSNLNPTLSNAPYVADNAKLSATCDSNWTLTPEGSLTNGQKCLVYKDGKVSTVNISGVCKGQWESTPVSCPNLPVCGGEAQKKCMEQINLGSCNCDNQEYEKSDPCHAICKSFNACTQACVGPLFAQACQD